MSELPKGWAETALETLCISVSDGDHQAPPKASSGVPFVTISSIWNGRIDLESATRFVPLAYKEALEPSRDPQRGDIVLSVTGSIGRAAIVDNPSFVFQRHIALIKTAPQIEQKYLCYFFTSDFTVRHLEELATGTAQKTLPLSKLRKLSIPLPPQAEQKRIVAKLDALNAISARARTELARIETLVSRYKQAVLSKAFSGELTASFEIGNSAALLDTDSDIDQLWSLPETWTWCRTDQIGRVGLGRQRSPKNHEGPQMRPYLRSANITWAGVDTSDVKEMNFDDADFKRFKLEVGDVLLNEGSGSAKEVGKPVIWRGEIADCCYQNTLLRVQPHRCSSEYAYYYFLLTARAGRFVSSTQGVNIQHIGREGLACYPFPLAPEPEQHEIVRRIESAFAKIDRLAKEAKRALELVGRLDEAFLAKAFRAELVPQDESDEPAEHLLARIRAEREAAPKGKRGRGAKG